MSRTVVDAAPFGRYAPKGPCAVALRATRRCSTGWLGKRTAFLLRGLAVRRLRGRPLDVVSLGAPMRLYPQRNVAEKRLAFTPQYFDAPERALLGARLKGGGADSRAGQDLADPAREEGYDRIDAIKLDIEGAEELVLEPFLRDAPRTLWPRLIIMEFTLLRVAATLETRLRSLGYREILHTGENGAYALDEEEA
jgi:hypothetical protein